MALVINALIGVGGGSNAMADVIADFLSLAGPVCVAVLVGLVAGWAWRPRWAAGMVSGSKVDAFTPPPPESESPVELRDELPVTVEDFQHLFELVQVRDGGLEWQQMMEKSMPGYGYRAWKREPAGGPPEYRSSTIFDNSAAEVVRDFFWDDEFRLKNRWDDMLLQHDMLEECEKTGTMVVRWVRKFPFFCSDREYIIGRRIWEVNGAYYCITKGVPRPSVPRQNKPRRVDLYYSSWCIRPVESRSGDGQMTACEVLLFHHEDMGIPWEIAKLGVRQGMWSCVKKIEPGLRAYQNIRSQGEPRSRYATMAGINTKVHSNYLNSMEETNTSSSKEIVEDEKPKSLFGNVPKFLLVGGAVAVACSIDRGLLTKTVIFGVARRFGKLTK